MPPLTEYRRKRHFEETPEPTGERAKPHGNSFVVQKHAARRLHYDLRLEIDGVLKSWAVPKGPSLNPAEKRLAVETEDHPLEYADFEGVIPEGNYGAGTVMVWDNGTFQTEGDLPAREQYARGEMKFSLRGHKLRGSFVLVKLKRPGKNEWLLIKHRDAAIDEHWNIDQHDGSVLTGRAMDEITLDLPASRSAAPAAGAYPEISPTTLKSARKAKMPGDIEPMLATLADKPFSDPHWLYEIKLDGVRALAWVNDGRFELRARRGRITTSQYPELAVLPERLRAKAAIVDGEIVVLDERGRSDFQRFQPRMNVSNPSGALVRQLPVFYYLFDIVYCDGYDLRHVPLIDRKNFLRSLLEPGDPIRYADHVVERGEELFELARQQGLEGIIGKDGRSPYLSRRTAYWLKFKVVEELNAVIGGWTAPRGSREHFGALLLGLYEDSKLRFIGGVGTGFDTNTVQFVHEKLKKLERARCPFDQPPKTREKSYWVEPRLVARVKFTNWTADRHLRAPVFLGLVTDRDPKDCRFESENPAPVPPSEAPGQAKVEADRTKLTEAAPSTAKAPAITGSVLSKISDIERELLRGRAGEAIMELDGRHLKLTNLNKVYFPESGYTKRRLLAYYYQMAEYVLPFLKDRPLVLRRYPNGIEAKSFFQKDAGQFHPEWMETVQIYSEDIKEEKPYFVCNDRASLLYLTNLGCIDHNPWPSRRDDLEHPDYFFFDLDPSQGTEFATLIPIARAIYEKLQSLGLTAFLKTSGATGFHLYVPIERRYTFEQVRCFADIVGRVLAAKAPKLITHERIVEKRRPGTVLIDAYQNSYGRPLAAPYTVRAFPKAPVSAPVSPSEMRPGLRPEQFNLKNMKSRVEREGNLWAEFWSKRRKLDQATNLLSNQLQPDERRRL